MIDSSELLSVSHISINQFESIQLSVGTEEVVWLPAYTVTGRVHIRLSVSACHIRKEVPKDD